MEETNYANRKIIILASGLIVLNWIMSFLLTYITIAVTPFLYIIVAAMICILTQQLNLVYKSLIIALLIIINDLVLKWTTQAYKLPENMEFINLMRLLGMIPAYLTVLIDALVTKKRSIGEKVLAIVLFPALIAAYIFGTALIVNNIP
ncbi:hypothetical protein DBR32_05570 [Taibaiella sp. KBW10]|uniref:hypothetical protein n=1 Tax=Taibaiella sp. KBW10 TaxID=2153357 RepID=UPI000F5B5B43|nr:hypothetical protein [Taibaiella sp. KBW10]RQO31430.1 hypothetical protein DBR32_05570 [Taibaiella sp. KBW10]